MISSHSLKVPLVQITVRLVNTSGTHTHVTRLECAVGYIERDFAKAVTLHSETSRHIKGEKRKLQESYLD